MSEEGPKLFTNKPKKTLVKQHQQQQASSAAPSMASTSAGKPNTPSPPPPKESFIRRYKFVWPLLLAVNFSVGAYLFMRTKPKDVKIEEEPMPAASSAPIASTTVTQAVTEKVVDPPPITEAVKVPEPIPESQQRELFKWVLEEKRKQKPQNPEEKKRIDEEKAILKHFIRAKSIPSL